MDFPLSHQKRAGSIVPGFSRYQKLEIVNYKTDLSGLQPGLVNVETT